MLGEIEFDEWQCVAELIDNAFDDFTEIYRSEIPWVGGFRVSVQLPGSADGELVIADTGRGMDYERLERAVRAGWTGNDMHDKLGLFGMGFNVSTARLGRRTRVLTTRQGDPEWIGVEIDLDRIGDDFEADDITEPKSDPNEHGTRIVVSRLHRPRAEWLRRNKAALRTVLGGVYSWMLENRPFELWIGGLRVQPVRHCRWGDNRSVLYNNKERIPAYIEIDQKLEDGIACSECGQWQLPGREVCEDCGSTRLAVRARRVHGWLGIQRYLDKRQYGIDFLRNGRKILRWDKQLFTWRNPDGGAGNEEPEYPVELAHQGGRIIGEIHLDHVPVTYQKDAFEYGDRSWRAVVEILRGVGPLLPQRAVSLGYEENTSPLARLFKGYRRNDAGERYLVPGDGRKPIHEDTRRWGLEFQKGNPDYQIDERWWRAVLDHEEAKGRGKADRAAVSTPGRPDETAVMEALGFGATIEASADALAGEQPATPQVEPAKSAVPAPHASRRDTWQERIERYTTNSVVYPELCRAIGHSRVGFVEIEARRLTAGPLLDEQHNITPLLIDQRRGNACVVFLDLDHEVFRRFGTEPADLLLVEVAVQLKVQTDSSWSHSQLVAMLRAESLPGTALDPQTISAEARELLAEIRSRMAASLDGTEEPQRAFQYLSPDELTATEHAMIANGNVTRTADLGARGDFLLHVPALFLIRLLEAWPEAFMDGQVFLGVYQGVTSASAQRLSLARTVGYLTDIATQASFDGAALPAQLLRTRLSIRLLADELADE
ncbi:ATP-binding protein [Embleya scabrispora]|uniref:ATP-binding protein n=1 Tax=Embleya scabrispora TaxID=159449 RepID=UPI000380D84A|nr:ATP-binding protein [Embleya scabrispora]